MYEPQESEINAQYSAIRGLIEDPSLLHVCQLTDEHMFSVAGKAVLSAAQALSNKGLKVDPVTILDRIPREFQDECRTFIADALSGAGVPKNFPAYEAILLKAARRRKVSAIAASLLDDPDKVDEALPQLTQTFGSSRWEHDQKSALRSAHELLDRFQQGAAGCTTGLPELDRMTHGLVPGRLTVVGGRPSMGKTAFGVSCLLASGVPSAIISSEMDVGEITLRMLSGISGIPLKVAQSGMDNLQWDVWNEASSALMESPILINDKPDITPLEIAAQVRKWAYTDGVQLVVVDYVQRLGGDPRLDRVEQIRKATTACKSIARQCNVHVILLSQVKRDVEYRTDKRPGLADFDGASTIESEADHAITLYSAWKYDKTANPRDAEVILVKNRHGEEGTVAAEFRRDIVRFMPSERKISTPF